MKITKHITFFYLENRIQYINNIINNTNEYLYKTDIFIHTNNIELTVDIFDKYTNGNIFIIYHDLSNINPFYLTWKCRELLKAQKDDYDIFMYIEDDILVPNTTINYWIDYNEKLWDINYNLGFVRIEFDSNNDEFITDLYGEQLDTIIELNENKYCLNNKNPYCAFWIYNKMQFNQFLESKYYDISNIKKYEIKEASAIGLHGMHTDYYKGTLIPIIDNKLHSNCRIYHISNNYVVDSTPFATIKFNEAIIFPKNIVYPISFSIPEEKLYKEKLYKEKLYKEKLFKEKPFKEKPFKEKILSDLIPGDISTYIYNNEEEYYNEYKKSYFAITMKKAGWDCMRHYEILANGCIPYFIDIDKCPINTMALLPKSLFVKGNELYDKKFKDKKIDELSDEDIDEYSILIEELYSYTKNYLTTKNMAKYILQNSNFTIDDKKILFLSGCTMPDYLRCLTLHGFKELFGVNCHDYPKIPHIYKSDSIDFSKLYGKGITYTNLLDPSLHNLNIDIKENIENKYYDIIIYGSFHRGMPYYDLISSLYHPNKIILLCGEDIHHCNYNTFIDRGHNVFVREL